MKHMKAVPQSKSKLAISAGLSALMVVSSLGVAPAMAFAGPSGKGVNQPKQQPTFEDIVKKVVSYDAAVFHPNAKQDELNEIYILNPAKDTQLVTPDDVAKEKTAIDQIRQTDDNAKFSDNLTDATKQREQAQKDLHAKYVAQESAEKLLEEEKNSDPLADLAQDASQALKDKALASHNEALQSLQKKVEDAKSGVATGKEALQKAFYAEIPLRIASLKNELATKVPESKKLANYEKWLAGKLAESKKLEKIDLGDFAEQYLMIPREEMDQTQTWGELIKKQTEVKNRIATLEGKIKAVKENADFKSLTESIKDLESQFAFLKKQLDPKTQPSDPVNPEPQPQPEPKPEPQPQPKPEPKPSQDKDEDYYGHDEKYTKDDNNPWMEGYSMEDHIDAMEKSYKEEKAGDKAAAELRKEINKNLGVSADDTSTLPGSDDNVYPTDPKMDVAAPSADGAKTPAAPSADGSVAPTQASDESVAPEEGKAEGKKALPQTNDFLATLLPMLGVALGGTSIAFGKRMRH